MPPRCAIGRPTVQFHTIGHLGLKIQAGLANLSQEAQDICWICYKMDVLWTERTEGLNTASYQSIDLVHFCVTLSFQHPR